MGKKIHWKKFIAKFRFWTSLIMGWTTRRKTQVILLLFELIVIPFYKALVQIITWIIAYIATFQSYKRKFISLQKFTSLPFQKPCSNYPFSTQSFCSSVVMKYYFPHPVLMLSTFPHVTKSFLHNISSFISSLIYYFLLEGTILSSSRITFSINIKIAVLEPQIKYPSQYFRGSVSYRMLLLGTASHLSPQTPGPGSSESICSSCPLLTALSPSHIPWPCLFLKQGITNIRPYCITLWEILERNYTPP